MNQYFIINARLPSLNELIAANRQGYRVGARLKRDTQTAIMWAITAANLKPVIMPCIVHMTFEEATKRRDTDNVESAKKFILDALVNTGILKGDGPKHVIGCPSWTRYGDTDQVLVTIIEDEREDALRERLQRCAEIVKGGQDENA